MLGGGGGRERREREGREEGREEVTICGNSTQIFTSSWIYLNDLR
jgi:hypothetical protein